MCWIIPLIVGILSVLLGYYWGKSGNPDNDDELRRLKEKNAALDKEVNRLGEQLTTESKEKSQFIIETEKLIKQYKVGETTAPTNDTPRDVSAKPSDAN